MKYYLFFTIWLLTIISCSRTVDANIDSETSKPSSAANRYIKQPLFLSAHTIQLASPGIEIDSVFFKQSATCTIHFDFSGAEVLYQINQGAVQVYQSPFSIQKTSILTVYASHPDFKNSEVTTLSLYKLTDQLSGATVRVNPPPHKNYPAHGPGSLLDQKKGEKNFRKGKYWAGFQSDTIRIDLGFKTAAALKTVTLSLLSDHASYIFLPKKIEIFNGQELVGTVAYPLPEKSETTALRFMDIGIREDRYRTLAIRIIPHPVLPDWHPGRGSRPWLFIDEVLVN